MPTIVDLCAVAILGVSAASDLSASENDATAVSSGPQGETLATLVTAQRKQKGLVGLAAMVTVDGNVIASAAAGERMKGSKVALDLGDRWHLGSITKSITATMIARLVESGKMQWSEKVGERFAEEAIHDDWKAVTLEQLLTHTSGAPANFDMGVMLKRPKTDPECARERRNAVLSLMSKKLKHQPGERFSYSNIGYTIAGAMAEKATERSWEDLVKSEVFAPLELIDSGFGPPRSPAKTYDQPRGHSVILGLKTGASDTADNTMIIGPAGVVHMTLDNLTKYATEHLKGELGTSKLLTPETFRRLHRPKLNNYACGWVVKEPKNKTEPTIYWHNGSNTMWYALVVFIPDRNLVVAVTSNDGDISQAEVAAWEIVKASLHLSEAAPIKTN